MGMGIKRIEKIPVYFSQEDPDQVAMLNWVRTRKNRSGYLKRLIQRDMDAAGAAFLPAVAPQQPSGDLDFQASSFI